jgi:hypothetical protein
LRISNSELLRNAAFVVVGVAISGLSEGLHAAWRRAEDRQHHLESEIVQRRHDDQQQDGFLVTLA